MSERVAGRPSPSRLARLAIVLGLVAVAALPAAPIVGAAAGLTVTTPFPAVVVDPGGTASFKLTVDVDTARRVDLQATGVPDGWTARFRGGGLVVDSVYADGKSAPDLTLAVDVPDDAPAGTTTIVVKATSGGITDSLPLRLRVAAAGAGDVTLTSDFPELRGPSSSTYTFNLTLKNDTATESTFSLQATGPTGWTVTAKPSGQEQATSTKVAAGSSAAVVVSATPADNAAADTYPVQVQVSGGGKTVTADLKVTITGTYTMTVSTPDQVLSTTANAGSQKDVQITVTNTGTAPLTDVKLAATAPTNWKTAFEPADVATIAPGEPATVVAHLTPTSDAIAGDYNVSVSATAAEASGNVTIRVRVETPQFWWIVGIVLIVATFAALYWVFRTYGRR